VAEDGGAGRVALPRGVLGPSEDRGAVDHRAPVVWSGGHRIGRRASSAATIVW
jgi:hypothetical protein